MVRILFICASSKIIDDPPVKSIPLFGSVHPEMAICGPDPGHSDFKTDSQAVLRQLA